MNENTFPDKKRPKRLNPCSHGKSPYSLLAIQRALLPEEIRSTTREFNVDPTNAEVNEDALPVRQSAMARNWVTVMLKNQSPPTDLSQTDISYHRGRFFHGRWWFAFSRSLIC